MGVSIRFSSYYSIDIRSKCLKPLLYLAFVFSLVSTSCNRIARKGKAIAHRTEEKISDKSDDLFPTFDAYKADSKFNKKRFRDFLKVEITDDVKNIYCHDDAIGIDADYQFGFNCNDSTAQRIIRKHQLTLDLITEDKAFGLQDDFDWWDKKKIDKLDLYSWTNGNQYFKYFWYDSKEQKAYFFDFDL